MKVHELRSWSRWLHIGGAAWFGTITYSPIGELSWAGDVSAFFVFPLLALSGLLMWKPRLLTQRGQARG